MSEFARRYPSTCRRRLRYLSSLLYKDGKNWCPFPDERFRPEIGWDGMRREEKKETIRNKLRGAMKRRAGKTIKLQRQ